MKTAREGSGSQHEVDDIMLTRYPCHLIAHNGDKETMPQSACMHTHDVELTAGDISETTLRWDGTYPFNAW